MKKIFVIIFSLFFLFSCSETKTSEIKNTKENPWEKIQITSSIIALASISNYIVWDKGEAKSLVPSWVSPHAFDLKASQILDIEKSDLIVYLWDELEHIDWFLHKAIENKKNTLDISKNIEILEAEEYEDEEYEHNNDNHSLDPHIWTSSENAKIIAKNILDELVKISPENKEYFEDNYKEFVKELDLLKAEFLENKKDKKEGSFIVFHDAYNYLFDELDISVSSKHVFRKNILSDLNSADMINLIEEIKSENIKIAFKEPQLDASSLKQLWSDYSIDIFVLNPLWTDESKTWYIENYRNNLKSLENIYE